jgi:hypothetical protein
LQLKTLYQETDTIKKTYISRISYSGRLYHKLVKMQDPISGIGCNKKILYQDLVKTEHTTSGTISN